jgi:LacI family transcriptional regulator
VAATLKDVAMRAGVSVGTVSNVLNHPDRVAADTRGRVEDAIRELDFVPTAAARLLRTRRALVLGLVVPDIANPFFTDVARGAEDAAMEAGYSVILCNSDARPDREDRYLSILEAQRVSGIIITPARSSLHPLDRLLSAGVAVTLLDHPTRRRAVSSVTVDHVAGGRLAADHAADLGHRTIGWVAASRDIPQVAAREKGLLAGAEHHGLSVVPIEAGAMTAAAGEAAATAYLAHGEPATMLVCANDLLALGAMRALRTAGVDVPGRMSVMGYDDIDFASHAAVSLTSIRQPRYELGRAAAQLAVAESRHDDQPHRHVSFTPVLVPRESTARVNG